MYVLNDDYVKSLREILEKTDSKELCKVRVMVAEVLGNVREFNITMKLAEQAYLISEEIKYLDRVLAESGRITVRGCPTSLRSTVMLPLLESLEKLRQQKEDELSRLGEKREEKVCDLCGGDGEIKIHGDFRRCPRCRGGEESSICPACEGKGNIQDKGETRICQLCLGVGEIIIKGRL